MPASVDSGRGRDTYLRPHIYPHIPRFILALITAATCSAQEHDGDLFKGPARNILSSKHTDETHAVATQSSRAHNAITAHLNAKLGITWIIVILFVCSIFVACLMAALLCFVYQGATPTLQRSDSSAVSSSTELDALRLHRYPILRQSSFRQDSMSPSATRTSAVVTRTEAFSANSKTPGVCIRLKSSSSSSSQSSRILAGSSGRQSTPRVSNRQHSCHRQSSAELSGNSRPLPIERSTECSEKGAHGSGSVFGQGNAIQSSNTMGESTRNCNNPLFNTSAAAVSATCAFRKLGDSTAMLKVGDSERLETIIEPIRGDNTATSFTESSVAVPSEVVHISKYTSPPASSNSGLSTLRVSMSPPLPASTASTNNILYRTPPLSSEGIREAVLAMQGGTALMQESWALCHFHSTMQDCEPSVQSTPPESVGLCGSTGRTVSGAPPDTMPDTMKVMLESADNACTSIGSIPTDSVTLHLMHTGSHRETHTAGAYDIPVNPSPQPAEQRSHNSKLGDTV